MNSGPRHSDNVNASEENTLSTGTSPNSNRRPVQSFFGTFFQLVRHPLSFPALVDALQENGQRETKRANVAEENAQIDALTGLPNRRAFDIQLKKAIAEADRHPDQSVALIMLDVDHFKQVNDKLGHKNGDEVLKTVGRILDRHHRTEDTAARIGVDDMSKEANLTRKPARYGGEEFAIILIGCSRENAKVIADEIRREIRDAETKLIEPRGDQTLHKITASFGVAVYDRTLDMPVGDATAGDSLVGRADAGLYAAKRNGRDRVAVTSDRGMEYVSQESTLQRQPRVVSGGPKP